jgi:hypothetical protein
VIYDDLLAINKGDEDSETKLTLKTYELLNTS